MQEKRAKKSGKLTGDKHIDFTEIPELTRAQLRSMRRVGRPPLGSATKLLIAVRIDPKVLNQLRKLADQSSIGYQTLIHEILEDYVEKRAA